MLSFQQGTRSPRDTHTHTRGSDEDVGEQGDTMALEMNEYTVYEYMLEITGNYHMEILAGKYHR